MVSSFCRRITACCSLILFSRIVDSLISASILFLSSAISVSFCCMVAATFFCSSSIATRRMLSFCAMADCNDAISLSFAAIAWVCSVSLLSIRDWKSDSWLRFSFSSRSFKEATSASRSLSQCSCLLICSLNFCSSRRRRTSISASICALNSCRRRSTSSLKTMVLTWLAKDSKISWST